MTTIFRASDIAPESMEEELLELPQAEPLTGDILTRTDTALDDEERGISAGTWDSAVGRSRWDFADYGEIIVLVAGKLIVTQDGGEPQEINVGDTAIFPPGWTGIWDVVEPLRKIWVVYNA